MHDLAEAWATGLRRRHPKATVRIARGAKLAAEGMAAVIEGRAQCALFVREPFPSELDAFHARFGRSPLLVPVAGGSHSTKGGTHAIAIFVNEANPLSRLTLAELDAIFSRTRRRGGREITTWGQLGLTGEWASRPIHAYGMLRRRETGNPPGIVNFLEQRLLMGGEFRDDVREQAGDAREPALDAIVRRVADDPGGIGYSGFAYARRGAKTLALGEGAAGPFFAGSVDEVARRDYPLSREIYVLVDREPGKPLSPIVGEFLLFALSAEGQAAVARDRSGFIALRPDRVAEVRKELVFAYLTPISGTLQLAFRPGR